MAKPDSYPGITAAELAGQMTDAGAYILDDFLGACRDRLTPSVFDGKPLASLVMQFQFALAPNDAWDEDKWTAERPDWPKDMRGRPYPFMPRQILEIGVAPPINGETGRVSYGGEDTELFVMPGTYTPVPKQLIDVKFSGETLDADKWRYAHNRMSSIIGGTQTYAQKYYMGAGAELAGVCAKLTLDHRKIGEACQITTGPKSVNFTPIRIVRSTLPNIATSTPLNGEEYVLDDFVRRGWYGDEARDAGTFYGAYLAHSLDRLTVRSDQLVRHKRVPGTEVIVENIQRLIEEANTAIESVKRFL